MSKNEAPKQDQNAIKSNKRKPRMPVKLSDSEHWAMRRSLIEKERSEVRRRRMLVMFELDRRTWPESLRPVPKRKRERSSPKGAPPADHAIAACIEQLRRYLPWRNRRRAALSLRGHEFYGLPSDQKYAAEVARIAPYYKDVIHKAVEMQTKKVASSGFDQNLFADAFCSFATGALALPSTAHPDLDRDSIPDSAMFLCFTESALLFAAQGHSPDFWRGLLPVLVAGTEAFAWTYWNGGERRSDSYQGVKDAVWCPDPTLKALRATMARMDVPTLVRRFGALSAILLADDALDIEPDTDLLF